MKKKALRPARRARTSRGADREVLLVWGYYDYRFHAGVARFARERGWHLFANMAHQQQVPLGWKGHGIISKVTPDNLEQAQFVAESGVPVLNVGRGIGRQFPVVLIDEESLSEMAAQHFLQRGYKNFAWYGAHPDRFLSPLEAPDLPNRPALYLRQIERAGFSCAVLDFAFTNGRTSKGWSEERDWLISRLEELPKPLGVYCYNDANATTLVHACRYGGLRVPEDIAILGTDNDPLACETLPVTLSSIDTDMEGRGYLGAALLEILMNGGSVPARTLAPVKGVVTRRSTDNLVITHPGVADAVDYIWRNFPENITVADIARQAGLSTRGLHKAFVAALGRSPLDELQRVRLIRARDLLESTDLDVGEVADRTGYGHEKNLYRIFSRTLGRTPFRHRREHRRNGVPASAGTSVAEKVRSLYSENPYAPNAASASNKKPRTSSAKTQSRGAQ